MKPHRTQSRSSSRSGNCAALNMKRLKRVAKAGCPEDDDAVAALPDDWKPRHSGPILTNYLQQRKKDYEAILDDIAKGAAAVNDDVDRRIHTIAENLLAHIQQSQRNIDCLIDRYDIKDRSLTAESRDEAIKGVQQLISIRIEDMANFKEEALALERERADKLRILLRIQFQRLVAVGHKTPKDLLHEFDERIYDINQQLLSNSRAYAELEANLRSQADDSVLRARSSLNQLCLGIEMAYRGRSALIWCKDEKVSRQRSHSNVARQHGNSDESLEAILDDVGEFDAIISRLVEAYRNAVLRVFTGFSSKLTELERDLGSHHDFHGPNQMSEFEFLDVQRLLERPLQRLSDNIKKRSNQNKTLMEITGADLVAMQKSLFSLGNSLRETCSILNHAGHLWDAHILRSALLQKLTIAAVEDLLTSHDAIELANEVPFNIGLAQLRCCPDADKLQQLFDAIVIMLGKTADMYLQHSEAELQRLEEFMNFPTVMANTLLAEFYVFLEKYPRTRQTSNATNQQSVTATPKRSPSVLSSIQMPLPRAIFQTELQEVALQNWRNGFLESFESNVNLVPDELKHQAQLWVVERSAPLHMRYSLKMVSHAIRLERVKAARDLRLREIRYHESRLESHLNAIYELVERLPEEASTFAAIDSPMLYPLCNQLERVSANLQALNDESLEPEVKRMKMKSYAPRLAKYRQLFEESLSTAIGDFRRHLENRVQEARISNVRFISQIKLFSEGGQYAAHEATKTCLALSKGADAVESCMSKTLDVLNHRRIQLLALADHEILPLQRSIEDTVKSTGKSTARIPEKKKAGKKK